MCNDTFLNIPENKKVDPMHLFYFVIQLGLEPD